MSIISFGGSPSVETPGNSPIVIRTVETPVGPASVSPSRKNSKKSSSSHKKDTSKWNRCPVTKEKFEHPIILKNCGHTFDKKVIEPLIVDNKKVCPLCTTSFSESSDDLLVNWHIVSAMDLNIPSKLNKSSSNIMTAAQLKSFRDQQLEKYLETQIPIEVQGIQDLIKGEIEKHNFYNYYVYKIKGNSNALRDPLIKKLNELGYDAGTNHGDFYVQFKGR